MTTVAEKICKDKEQSGILDQDDLSVDPSVQVIEARSGWRPVDLRELWRYRELLMF